MIEQQTLWITLITALSTLIAGIVGSVITYKVGYKNIQAQREIERAKIKADLITQQRLLWLKDLKNDCIEFYADLDMQYNLLKRLHSPADHDALLPQFDSYAQNVRRRSHNIILTLNPQKATQNTLRECTQKALTFFKNCVLEQEKHLTSQSLTPFYFDDAKYAQIKSEFNNAMAELGAEVWRQVKNMQ